VLIALWKLLLVPTQKQQTSKQSGKPM